MAIDLNGSTQDVRRTSGVIDANGAYTWMAWVQLDNVTSPPHMIQFTNGADDYDALVLNGSGVMRFSVNGNDQLGSTLSTATWYHIAIKRVSTTDARMYLNGVQDGSTNTTDISARSSASMFMYAGSFAGVGGTWMDGRFAGMKLWDVALSDAEILNELRTLAPRKLANLWSWSPMVHNAIADALLDFSGNGRNWTGTATPTLAQGPPVSFHGPATILPFAAAAGPAPNAPVFRLRRTA